MKLSFAAKVVGVVCMMSAFAAIADICIPSLIGSSSGLF
jgi:hypothetical protein